jgi:hypothetical protein
MTACTTPAGHLTSPLNRENASFKIDTPREALTRVAQFQRQGFSGFPAVVCHRI